MIAANGTRPNKEELKGLAAHRWREILTNVGGIPGDSLDSTREHPCPKCGGSTRFRFINEQAGAVRCSHCFPDKCGDGIAAVQWARDVDFPDALLLIGDYLGMTSTNGHASNGHRQSDAEILRTVCAAKRMPVAQALAYGAKAGIDRGKPVLFFPAYDEMGQKCATFKLDSSGKGLWTKGDKHGLFLPHDAAGNPILPQPGETWLKVEGVKDAAALAAIGFNVAGLPTSNMAARFARLFRGCDVDIVHDLDKPGLAGAKQTRSRLEGVAQSIGIARLPGEMKESDGLDARDVLAKPDGEKLVRQAIADSLADPENSPSLVTDSTGAGDLSESVTVTAIESPHKSFPVETLPGVVGEYVRAAAKAIGCDISFIALPMLCCLARAIGNTRSIRLKRTWCELPIVWAAIIGKSGTHKTPALQAATLFLQKKQAASIAKYAEAMQEHEIAKAQHERNLAEWKKLKTSEPPPSAPEEPTCTRFITTDVTIEALASLLAAQFDGILVTRDELAGWLSGIAEYKGGKGSDLGHWLAAWSGADLIVDRKTGAKRMVHVPRASVSLVGGIQPGVLRDAIGREHMQDGLCARLLMAMPDPRPVTWTDDSVDWSLESRMAGVFDVLLTLEAGNDLDGNPEPVPLDMTPEGKGVWIEYFDRHRGESAGLEDDLAAAWSKLEAYTARLALIFQLCLWAEGSASCDAIDESSVLAAITLSDWFGGEAKRVYGLFVESSEDRDARELIDLINRHGRSITARDLAHSCRKYRAKGAAESALEKLARAGAGSWSVEPTATNQKRTFVLTPLPPVTVTDSTETLELRESVTA